MKPPCSIMNCDNESKNMMYVDVPLIERGELIAEIHLCKKHRNHFRELRIKKMDKRGNEHEQG